MKFEDYINKRLQEDKEFAKVYYDKENDFAFDVANLITEARLHAGLTQDALAKKIGTTQPAIARIERGSALPSLSFLQKIAKALGTYLIAPKFGFMEEGREVKKDTTVKLKTFGEVFPKSFHTKELRRGGVGKKTTMSRGTKRGRKVGV